VKTEDPAPSVDSIIVAGDLRGDSLALLYILQLADVVEGVNYEAVATAIRSDNFTRARTEVSNMTWKNTTETLVLLGDVLGLRSSAVIREDEVRERSKPLTLHPESEKFLMEMLTSLDTDPKKKDHRTGRVRWVLGDIDMQSITNEGKFDCAEIHDEESCNGETNMQFNYQKQARKWARQFKASPLLVIDGLLFCHAALSNGFLARYKDCTPTPDSLLESINKDYEDSVKRKQRVKRITLYGDDVPDHCSLERMDNDAMERLGCRASFLGGRADKPAGIRTRISKQETTSNTHVTPFHAPDYTFDPVTMDEVQKIHKGAVYHMNTLPRILLDSTSEAQFGCAILTRSGDNRWTAEFKEVTKYLQNGLIQGTVSWAKSLVGQ
jgi:hypothetical protein